ncbi:MAG: DNA-processing protein DprA, partial [Pseudomonadota bacterium]
MTLALDIDHAAHTAPLGLAERLDHLRLARSQNVGPRSYASLIRRFGSARRALEVLPELAVRGGKRDYVPCPIDKAEAELEAGAAAGAELLVIGEDAYPPLLAALDNPPPVLWLRGQAPVLHREAIAVVGARNASA